MAGSDAEKLADVPHHLEIDRSYLHPFARGGKVRRAVALNSADTIIKNSYLQGFAFPGEETQAIAGWNGTKRRADNDRDRGALETVRPLRRGARAGPVRARGQRLR